VPALARHRDEGQPPGAARRHPLGIRPFRRHATAVAGRVQDLPVVYRVVGEGFHAPIRGGAQALGREVVVGAWLVMG
jgi:hypothetical protein